MNKIVLLSDNEQLSRGALEFAKMLNEQNPILLSGVFLPPFDYRNMLFNFSYGMSTPMPYYPIAEVEPKELALSQFRILCERNSIEYRIHEKAYADIEKELRTEARFADMMLFSNEALYSHLEEATFEEYTKEVFHDAQCPVVIVPENFHRPDNIILAYDGSASSVYAMKQFAYLMPELAKLDTTLVYVNPNEVTDFPEKAYLEELAARHFPNLTLLKLDIDPKKYFTTWLTERKNAMLVAGAKGRNGISELFRKSFIKEILTEHILPVFTAHT